MTKIHLHTLGDCLITVGEREIRPTAPLVFAALLYLAMERGRRVPRAVLQALLFPDVDERSRAHSLRQLLYKLRRLGAPIRSDATGLWVTAEDVVDDLEIGITPAAMIQRSIGIGRGLLRDYSPRLSVEFTEWVDAQRASATSKIRRQLVTALSESRDAVNWLRVEHLSHLILELDPLHEEATLALAEATAITGSKGEAITILTRYEEETGSADLRLPASLLRKRVSEAQPRINATTVRVPFVGRDADACAIRRSISRSRKGEVSFLVICGEPGIGKTRLIEELGELARLEGDLVLSVRCQPYYSSRPLSAFIDLVPALLSCRGALGISPRSLANLNRLISHDDLAEAHPADARDNSSRLATLLAALRDLVDAVASETPLTITIDDAHWSDADSLRELTALVRGRPTASLAVILITRHLGALRRMVPFDDSTVVRRLKPLDGTPMATLAKHLLHGNSIDAAGSWCVETARGNPFFLQVLCAHLLATGEPFAVPPDMLSATAQRIESLSAECRRLLEFCALLGRNATVEALRSVTELTHLQLLRIVEQLEDEGFLQVRDEVASISHHLMADRVVGLVTPLAKRVLHARVASYLESRYESTNDASVMWDCTEQWAHSGESEKALQFLKRCARHASLIGKSAHALDILDRARDLARYPIQLGDVLAEMVLTARAMGNWPKAYECATQLNGLKGKAVLAIGHTPVELVSIEAHWVMTTETSSLSKLAICASERKASHKHRVDAALLLIRMCHELGEIDRATAAYHSVEPLLADSATSYPSRILPIIYHTTFGDREQALTLSRRLVNEIVSFESLGDQLRASVNVAFALATLGHCDEATHLLKPYLAECRRLGMKGWEAEICTHISALLNNAGRASEADWWHTEASRFDAGLNQLINRTYLTNKLEQALRNSDFNLASDTTMRLRSIMGQTVRGRASMFSAHVRTLQLAPDYQCDDQTLTELFANFHSTKKLLTADAQVLALCEALRRRGQRTDLRAVLDDYFKVSRRELGPAASVFAPYFRLLDEEPEAHNNAVDLALS